MRVQKKVQCDVELDIKGMGEGDISRLIELATARAHVVDVRVKSIEDGKISADFGDGLQEAQDFIEQVDRLVDSYGEND